MPMIPADELARLKAVPLLDLCRDYGIELKHAGKDWKGRCPFHDDGSPSFVVTPAKNLWNCLGACGCGGDSIQLVMRKESVSFRHACEKLRARAGGAPSAPRVTTRLGTSHDALATPQELADSAALLGRVAEFYHRSFLNEPAAMKYLQSRACFHPEAASAFQLGYANRTLGYRIPPQETAAGRELKTRLQSLGVLRATGHEHLNGCVVFPLRDADGRCAQLYGRRLTESASPRHLYLSGPQRGVWNADALKPGADWFVCEALIDALTLWCHGWRSVTASYGVNGWTSGHAALVAERKPARVVICYDADAAGHAQAAALAKQLAALGVAAWRAAPPEGRDINDVARAASDPAAALRAVVDGARLLIRPEQGAALQPARVADPRPADASALRAVASGLGEVSADALHASRAPSSLAAIAAKKEAADTTAKTSCNEMPQASPGAGTASLPAGGIRVLKKDADEIVLCVAERNYRVRGLAKNAAYDALKISLRLASGNAWHLDTLDLAQAKQRAAFTQAASEETGIDAAVIKRDIGRVLLKLEELQEERLRAQVAPENAAPKMSDEERAAALALLRDPQLLERVKADFAACGVVGEETNKLVGYIAAVSRKLEKPLAVIVQSTSAAGKTALMESVLAFVPPEDRVKYSALTGQALYYLGGSNLKHKVLAIVEEEGAEKASYALKLLQSEGELTIASTGKDPHTGRMETQEYRVEGPVMIFLTTTAVDIDEELLNRCLVLTVDEGREQTAAIHRMQREGETLGGLLRAESRARVLALHRDAQRLLRPLRVVNPFAERLTFLDDRTRTRRDHTKYLALIRVIALLHQHQREVKRVTHDGREIEYIEATASDIAAANALAHEVLGRCLDEMPPQTRRLLALLETMVARRCEESKIARADARFSRRAVREFTGWGNSQLHVHLRRLADLEYLITHRADHGTGFVYELVYDGGGRDGKRFMSGLFDVNTLQRPAQNAEHPAAVRPASGGNPAMIRGAKNAALSYGNAPKNARTGKNAHQANGAVAV